MELAAGKQWTVETVTTNQGKKLCVVLDWGWVDWPLEIGDRILWDAPECIPSEAKWFVRQITAGLLN